jgi:hypothetical protein
MSVLLSMRWATKYPTTIMVACIVAISLNVATAQGEDISDLKRLISSYEDTRINSQDLAFFLATHNYRAIPEDDHVEVDLNGLTCKLVPNGNKPGICDIELWHREG